MEDTIKCIICGITPDIDEEMDFIDTEEGLICEICAGERDESFDGNKEDPANDSEEPLDY